ncbi:hypothetical protein DdX_16749 [Ditylenchus destructor]|uniref:Uncharacterized protein n=1 Tax=Ditylenchus destructor TaxID=166010 RepID=A0AAD4MPV5_9BILA|nr:hypothetical protein DdX_16749 [Ditylenchus destructor]
MSDNEHKGFLRRIAGRIGERYRERRTNAKWGPTDGFREMHFSKGHNLETAKHFAPISAEYSLAVARRSFEGVPFHP